MPFTIAVFSTAMVAFIVANSDSCKAQMPLPVYIAPTPIVAPVPVVVAVPMVAKRTCCRRPIYPQAVPVQATYAAYYAPQVPVIPVTAGYTPTMSAYYMPTAPVVQAYYAPAVPVRRVRRYAVPFAPAAVYPVYWRPY